MKKEWVMFIGENESNSLDKKIVGVFPSLDGGFPSISYEDDFSETKTVTNGKVEFACLGDTNLSDIIQE
jgi:hypothetical protein